MSSIKIAAAIKIIRGVTDCTEDHEVRSVGASIFADTEVTDQQRNLIEVHLNPQRIKQLDGKVRVDL